MWPLKLSSLATLGRGSRDRARRMVRRQTGVYMVGVSPSIRTSMVLVVMVLGGQGDSQGWKPAEVEGARGGAARRSSGDAQSRYGMRYVQVGASVGAIVVGIAQTTQVVLTQVIVSSSNKSSVRRK
jgi:hypothetical protein